MDVLYVFCRLFYWFKMNFLKNSTDSYQLVSAKPMKEINVDEEIGNKSEKGSVKHQK